MRFVLYCLCLLIHNLTLPVTFQGLVETGISKNSFLCPRSAAGAFDCQNADSQAIGALMLEGQTVQLFNNQAYWLKQESEKEQYVQTVQRYTGPSLEREMTRQGWVAMGGYCILISTNQILQSLTFDDKPISPDQIKVIVQLWYNGSNLLQLWSQDVQVLPKSGQFKIVVTSDPDSDVKTLNSLSGEIAFLSQLGLVPNNRQLEYQQATSSPRKVRIQVVS